jgi:hypothetical protein
MDESVAREFQSEGITGLVIIDYKNKHQQGLYVCGTLPWGVAVGLTGFVTSCFWQALW